MRNCPILYLCVHYKFLMKSQNKTTFFPSLEIFSIKFSNLPINSTFESVGRYIFPIRKGLLLPTVVSNQMHAILLVSKSILRLALMPFRSYTVIPSPSLLSVYKFYETVLGTHQFENKNKAYANSDLFHLC